MNERDRALADAASIADCYATDPHLKRYASDVAASIAALIRSRMVRPHDLRAPTNSAAWGIGHYQDNGRFNVRRVVWGKLMARMEKRKGEQIVPLVLLERRKVK